MLVDGWSVTVQYHKCGRPGSKVCSKERGRGPYYYETRMVDGKREIRYFGRKKSEPSSQVKNIPSQILCIRPPLTNGDNHSLLSSDSDRFQSEHCLPATKIRNQRYEEMNRL